MHLQLPEGLGALPYLTRGRSLSLIHISEPSRKPAWPFPEGKPLP